MRMLHEMVVSWHEKIVSRHEMMILHHDTTFFYKNYYDDSVHLIIILYIHTESSFKSIRITKSL